MEPLKGFNDWQVSNNLLPEWQSATFIELIRDIVQQAASNPDATPVLNPAHHSALRLNIDKVQPYIALHIPITTLQLHYTPILILVSNLWR